MAVIITASARSVVHSVITRSTLMILEAARANLLFYPTILLIINIGQGRQIE